MCAVALHTRMRQRSLWTMFAVVLASFTGCADPLPEEHKATISRMQGLGGKVLFSDGGYALNMENSRLSDDDLKDLQHIHNLRVLHLQNTRVTDTGLPEIAKLKSLVRVYLAGTPTSREAREALAKQRPDLTVRQ